MDKISPGHGALEDLCCTPQTISGSSSAIIIVFTTTAQNIVRALNRNRRAFVGAWNTGTNPPKSCEMRLKFRKVPFPIVCSDSLACSAQERPLAKIESKVED